MAKKKKTIPDIPAPLPTTAQYNPSYDNLLRNWGPMFEDWNNNWANTKVTIEKGNVTGLPATVENDQARIKELMSFGMAEGMAYEVLQAEKDLKKYEQRLSAKRRTTAEKLELKEVAPSEDMVYRYLPKINKEGVTRYTRPVVVFDVETGASDDVISLAAVKLLFNKSTQEYEILDTYERAYYTKDYTSRKWQERQAVHGITKKSTAKLRYEQKAKYGKFYNADEQIAFRKWIGSNNTILVGHNSEAYDIPVTLGYDQPYNNIDTLIAMENIRGRGGNKLHQVFERLTGVTMEDAGLHHHAAMSDVIATAIILRQLTKDPGRTGRDIKDILATPGLSLAHKNEYINSQISQGGFMSYYKDMTAYVLPGEIQKMAKFDENTESIASMINNAGELMDAVKGGLTNVDDTSKKKKLAPGFSKKKHADEGPAQEPEDVEQDAWVNALSNVQKGVSIDMVPILGTLAEIKKIVTAFTSTTRELHTSAAALQYSQRGSIVSRLSNLVDLKEPLYRPELESMKDWVAMADYLEVPDQERIRAYKASYAAALRKEQGVEEKDIASSLIKVNLAHRSGAINDIQAKDLRDRAKAGESAPIIAQDIQRAVFGNNLERQFSLAFHKGELSHEQIDWLRKEYNEAGGSPAHIKYLMQTAKLAHKQEELRGKEEHQQALREQAIGYMKSLSPWEKAGLLTKHQVKALGKEALAEDWTPEQGESRRQDAIRTKELQDKVWRAEQIKDAIKSGRITASQGKKIEDSVVVNEQLAGAIDKAAQSTKNWVSALQALSQIPVFDPMRIHNAYASGISAITESSASVIPSPVRKLGSRFGKAVMENDMAKLQYFRATDKTLTAASPLISVGTSLAGAAIGSAIPGLGTVAGAYIGSQIPGAAQGAFNLGTQVWGNYKEAGITKMFQQMAMRFDVLGTTVDFVTLPLTLLAKATKGLHASFLGLGGYIKHLIGNGLDRMSQLGNPLTHLTGVGYARYQQLSTQDAFFGNPEGSLNTNEEDFRRQAELLYNSGQYDQRRLVNASRLGIFNEVYGPQASFESTVNTLLKRDLSPSEMSLLHAISPQLAPTYELLKKAGATSMGGFFNQAGAGLNLYPLSDKQQVAFKTDVYQSKLLKQGMGNSWMIIADKLWSSFGKDILSGLNDVLHSIATGSDWDNIWRNFKNAIAKAWGKLDWGKIRQVGSDAWGAVKTKVFGLDEDQSFLDTAKDKIWKVATKLVDVWVSGVATAIDKLAPIISDFINWFNTIEIHPENALVKGKDVISFGRVAKDSDPVSTQFSMKAFNAEGKDITGHVSMLRDSSRKKSGKDDAGYNIGELKQYVEDLKAAGATTVSYSYNGKYYENVPIADFERRIGKNWAMGGEDYAPTVRSLTPELHNAGDMVKTAGGYVVEGAASLAQEIVQALTSQSLRGKLEIIVKGESGNVVQKSTVDISSKSNDNNGNMQRIIINAGNGGR